MGDPLSLIFLNDAEDSPVVDDRGDENQLHVGVMAIYVSGFSFQVSVLVRLRRSQVSGLAVSDT